MRAVVRLVLLLACLLAQLAWLPARALEALPDEVLSDVRGRDGLMFDLSNFAVSGNATLTYYAPAPDTSSIWWGNFYATRSDNTAAPYGDPYQLQIVGRAGMADVIELLNPVNAGGVEQWQIAFDWGVNADGINAQGGTVMARNLAIMGGGLQITTPTAGTGDGVAWGLSLGLNIGNLMFQPRGRDTDGFTDPSAVPEQLNLSGVHIGAATSDGSNPTQPWVIADATNQPGILTITTDPDGTPHLHVGIGWPQNGTQAPVGTIAVDNITFQSDVTGNVNLGASRIAGIQIQYMDIKFK